MKGVKAVSEIVGIFVGNLDRKWHELACVRRSVQVPSSVDAGRPIALIELFKSISVLGKWLYNRLLVDLTLILREATNPSSS